MGTNATERQQGEITEPSALGSTELSPLAEPVSAEELNSWRRGFTPQAELWNGRLAMIGLSVGLTVVLLSRFAAG
ncbi:MAG: high light inducible protein [Cyanobacteriota bacterium]|nr:high light inducible protein [Cyanobacteriota bacterium]